MTEYEKYQLEWMAENNVSLKDIITDLTESHDEFDSIFDDWEREEGFEGELWASYREWLDNERKNETVPTTLGRRVAAYENYKIQWLIDHDHSLENLFDTLYEYEENWLESNGLEGSLDIKGHFDDWCAFHEEGEFTYPIWLNEEQWKKEKDAQEQKAEEKVSNLPEHCYVYLPTTHEIGIVKRGESGYYRSDLSPVYGQDGKEFVDELNRDRGITKAQSEAMKAGSMFGWHTPAADPKNYDENGKPIKPKRNKDYER